MGRQHRRITGVVAKARSVARARVVVVGGVEARIRRNVVVPVLGRGGQIRGRVRTVVWSAAGAGAARAASVLAAATATGGRGGAAAAAVRVADAGGVHRLVGVLAGELPGRRHRGAHAGDDASGASTRRGCTPATSAGPSSPGPGAARARGAGTSAAGRVEPCRVRRLASVAATRPVATRAAAAGAVARAPPLSPEVFRNPRAVMPAFVPGSTNASSR